MAEPVMPEYLWLLVVGSFAAFAYGWSTGANDVANAFATSVGAKTLTMPQAILAAAIFEFGGALLLGRVVTSVIAGNISNIDIFYSAPEIYAYGMVCALTIAFAWQAGASYYEMNVSATHSVIGAIIGFSMVYGGADAVNWATKVVSTKARPAFPPYTGVLPIVLAWFVSPVLAATASCLLFFILRTLVLRRKNGYYMSFLVLPPAVMLTGWVCVYFILTRGAMRQFQADGREWTTEKAAWVSAAAAGGVTLLVILVLLPFLIWRTDKIFKKQEEDAAAAVTMKITPTNSNVEEAIPVKNTGIITPPKNKFLAVLAWPFLWLYHRFYVGMTYDIHEIVMEDPVVAAIHSKAEVFDPKVEYAFKYLQVFSACCVIFAHGAGEVGQMAGPLSAIWDVYQRGTLSRNTQAPIWCILIGAFGLMIGLSTYGYKCCQAMGTRMAKLSPTRGFCAELSTAMIIMIASQYGLPTSSSQIVTGGIMGVGLLEGAHGINWVFFGWTFLSWVLTIVVVALGSGALFAMGAFAPSISCVKSTFVYENNLVALSNGVYRDALREVATYINATNATHPDFRPALVSSGRMTAALYRQYTQNLNWQIGNGTAMIRHTAAGTVRPEKLITHVARAYAFLQLNSVLSIGQVAVFPGARLCSDRNFTGNSTAACRGPAILRSGSAPFNTTTFTWV